MGLLLDFGPLSPCCTDTALDHIYKAMSEGGDDTHDIWAPHESPFIRALVERFTERGLARLETVRQEVAKWAAGEYYVPRRTPPQAPPGFLTRWTTAELDLARIYLSSIPPDSLSLSDWELVIEYMTQRYMPLTQLYEEAEWLVTKAALMGRVQSILGAAGQKEIPEATATSLMEALPGTVDDAVRMFRVSDSVDAVMSYGRIHACDEVRAVSEATRRRLRTVIADHQLRRYEGDITATPQDLEKVLRDEFSTLNRDWRRIALTEAGEMANQGTIMSLPVGSMVRRVEMYRGACAFCRRLDGRIFRVTTAADPKKDGERDVWPGKTNIGRSASPRKRVGDELIDRTASERWWAAAGVQHPHCRGRWEPMKPANANDDPAFAEWMRRRLGHTYGLPSPV